LSDKVLRAVVTETIDGRLQAVPFEKKGPISYVESTSAATVFAEDANRCLVLHVDEDERQTRAIIAAAARAAAEVNTTGAADYLVAVHHAAQRMLKPYTVVIPFAPMLAEKFPVNRVEARRAMPHLLSCIKAVALLRQYQKVPT